MQGRKGTKLERLKERRFKIIEFLKLSAINAALNIDWVEVEKAWNKREL